MGKGFFVRNVFSAFSDDDDKLRFIVHLLRYSGEIHRMIVCVVSIRVFAEQYGSRGIFFTAFIDMCFVVDADADQFSFLRSGRGIFNICFLVRRSG